MSYLPNTMRQPSMKRSSTDQSYGTTSTKNSDSSSSHGTDNLSFEKDRYTRFEEDYDSKSDGASIYSDDDDTFFSTDSSVISRVLREHPFLNRLFSCAGEIAQTYQERANRPQRTPTMTENFFRGLENFSNKARNRLKRNRMANERRRDREGRRGRRRRSSRKGRSKSRESGVQTLSKNSRRSPSPAESDIADLDISRLMAKRRANYTSAEAVEQPEAAVVSQVHEEESCLTAPHKNGIARRMLT